MTKIKVIFFDWGDTVMRDFPQFSGPMCDWPKVEYIPGVEKVLQSLHGQHVLVIATNAYDSGTEQMRKALRKVGAEKYFNHFFSSKDLNVEKPDKRFFIELITRLNVAPEECLVVGNSYEKDVIPASQAGLKAVFFNERIQSGDHSVADFIIHSMSELMLVINQLEISN